MAEWVVCPSCHLKHSARADRLCPRCHSSLDSGQMPESAVSTTSGQPLAQPPAFPQLPQAGTPSRYATPGSARSAAAPAGGFGICPNHPHVSEGLLSCTRCGGRFCSDCIVALRAGFYCAACKEEQVRDLQSGTASGAFDFASVGRRFGGIFLDGMLVSCASYAVIIPILFLVGAMSARGGQREPGGPEILVVLIIYPILIAAPIVYEALMLQYRGQTLGKMAVGVRVVTPEGHDITPGQAWGRAVAKLFLASCMGATYFPALFTAEKTCLHDMLAKTRVVRTQG